MNARSNAGLFFELCQRNFGLLEQQFLVTRNTRIPGISVKRFKHCDGESQIYSLCRCCNWHKRYIVARMSMRYLMQFALGEA